MVSNPITVPHLIVVWQHASLVEKRKINFVLLLGLPAMLMAVRNSSQFSLVRQQNLGASRNRHQSSVVSIIGTTARLG
jgi:hypothetical protein